VDTLHKSSSKTKRKRLKAETRRQQLLAYAVETTAKNGLGKAKHTDIAKLADVAVSTVFFYFPSVDMLNNAVIDEIEKVINLTELVTLITEKSDKSLLEVLENYVQTFDTLISQNKHALGVFLEWSNSINSSMWPRYQEYRELQFAELRKVLTLNQAKGEIHSELDLTNTTTLVAGTLKMILSMKCFDDTSGAVDDAIACLGQHLVKGKDTI